MPKISQIDEVPRQAEVRILQKTTLKKGFLDTAADYQWDAAASEAYLRHDFRLSATI